MLDADRADWPELIGELADEMRARGIKLENTPYGKHRAG
jgi:hypothetical protein